MCSAQPKAEHRKIIYKQLKTFKLLLTVFVSSHSPGYLILWSTPLSDSQIHPALARLQRDQK